MAIPADTKIAIGLPRGADTMYHYETIESMFMMFGQSPCQYKMISVSKVHHVARNTIVEHFLDTDMDYLLFIDSDMIWEPDSVELAYNLIQQEQVDIVTGIYFTKGAPHLPVIKKLDIDAGCYNIFVEWGNQPFEVDGAGLGFMLISRKVLEAMKQPLFTWDGGFSEDLNFCLKAKKDHGFKIWAHPGIKLGHIGNSTITNFDYMKQFKPGIKAYIREAMVGTKLYLKKYYPNWREDLGIHPLQFKNINTAEHWDKLYSQEGGADLTWRDYPEKHEFIIDLLKGSKPDLRVLELGCGVGVFAKRLKEGFPDVLYFGVDISTKAIEWLKSSGFDGVVGSIPPINFGKKVDVIIGLEFLEHLDDEPRLKLIKEASKSIVENGCAIFSVPDDCLSPDELAEHRVKYDKDTFEKFLKQAFKNVVIHQVESKFSTMTDSKCKYLVAICKNEK